MFEAIQIKY